MADTFSPSDFVPDPPQGGLFAQPFSAHDFVPDSHHDDYATDPIRTSYQAAMNDVAKPVNSAVGNAISALMPQSLKDAGSYLVDKEFPVASKLAALATQAGKNEITDLSQYNQDLSHDLSAFGENAKLAGSVGALKTPIEAIGNAGQDVAEARAAIPKSPLPTAGIPKPSEYDPITTHSAISGSYGAAKAATQPYYNFMREIASGESADASGLKPALNSMISDIENTPFHEAASELPYLRQQAAKISEDGTMPLNDMVSLKQNINSNFNPKRFAQGADTPYSVVSGIVNDSLEDAADRIPDFGEAKSLADKNWLNTVKAPFEDNTVLQKFWKPEDYYAKKSVDSGMLEDLPDPTKQRATEMLGKVKTPIQLDAIRRTLPQDLSDAFSQAKIQDITQGSGVGRLDSAGKAVMGVPGILTSPLAGTANVVKNLANVISPQYKPWQMDLIDAAKQQGPTLSTKYQQPFQNLKGLRQQELDSASEMQPFSYSKPEPVPKQLTYQPSIMSVPSEGPNGTIPMNPAIRESLGQSPSTIAEKTPSDVLRDNEASTNSQSELLRKIGTKRMLGNENIVPPKYEPTAKGALGNAALIEAQKVAEAQKLVDMEKITPRTIQQDYNDATEPYEETEMARKLREAGFKQGGRVQPTEAQKLAGNYKKPKLAIHGLNISIETPKGEIRSGKDMHGNEWQVKMPVSYGYILGTIGADKEHIDCFVGPNQKSLRVYVIDQKHHDSGKFDESKVMLGFKDRESAISAYKSSYSDKKNRIMCVRKMLMPEFKDWLKNGNTKKPIKQAA